MSTEEIDFRRISSTLSVHGTHQVSASHFADLDVFKLTLGCGNFYHGETELTLHLDAMPGLAGKLAKAVNDCVAEYIALQAVKNAEAA